MSQDDITKFLLAVENRELSAVGIYIEDAGYRIAEVEFRVDWDEHDRMIEEYGAQFDIDLPGWSNSVSPEAHVAAQRLVLAAKEMKKVVRSWISVSPSVRKNPKKYKLVCDTLGYSYGSKVCPWKDKPIEQTRNINYLSEAKLVQRVAR